MDYCKVIKHIPQGKDNAVSRYDLARMLDVSERVIRKAIENGKRAGFLIASNPKGGYYRISNRDEATDYFKREFCKARTLLENLNILQNNIRIRFPEMQLNLELEI